MSSRVSLGMGRSWPPGPVVAKTSGPTIWLRNRTVADGTVADRGIRRRSVPRGEAVRPGHELDGVYRLLPRLLEDAAVGQVAVPRHRVVARLVDGDGHLAGDLA